LNINKLPNISMNPLITFIKSGLFSFTAKSKEDCLFFHNLRSMLYDYNLFLHYSLKMDQLQISVITLMNLID